jgi:hypothetical protein
MVTWKLGGQSRHSFKIQHETVRKLYARDLLGRQEICLVGALNFAISIEAFMPLLLLRQELSNLCIYLKLLL